MSEGSKETVSMILEELLDEAILLAASWHYGQRDKGGQPYILHCLRVMLHCQTLEQKIVAVLHDILEDTAVPEFHVKGGYPQKIVDAIVALTQNKGETYWNYIRRLSNNPLAVYVKLQDLEDNMNRARIPAGYTGQQPGYKRYDKAFKFLWDIHACNLETGRI